MSDATLVEFCNEDARVPSREGKAAGYDAYATSNVAIPPGGRALISTGLKIAAPSGTYIRIAPRSGLAWKHGIQTGAGVVDEDYRGEIKVLLFNHGAEEFQVNKGDRVAQLIFEKIVTPELMVVPSLDDTERGEGGFGSTGK